MKSRYSFILCFITFLLVMITGCSSEKKTTEPNQAPTVSITSGPSGTIITNQATFNWSGSDSDGSISGYYYDLDDSTPDTWTSSTTKTFYGLSNGSHTFYVQAKDNDGDLSTIASRSFIVDVATHESQEGITNSNGQYSFHSDVLNEDIIIATYQETGQPVENIIVYFYTDGNDIIVTSYDSSENYYPMAYFASVRSFLEDKKSDRPLNIILDLLGLSGNLFTIIENPPSYNENHLLNLSGIQYLGNASFQTVGSMIGITGFVLACIPEAVTTIIGVSASLASTAIAIAGELGLNIQQEYEWYRINGTNFIFCIAVSQPNPGSIMGYTSEAGSWMPIIDVLVKLYDSSNNYTGLSTYSYTEMGMGMGYFIINNVVPGDYYLILSKSGYENKRNPSTGFFTVYEGALNNRGVLALNLLTIDIEFVNVPAGQFTYGQNNEILTIDYDYEIMKYEVTNEQYITYLEEALANDEITVSSSWVWGYYEGDEYWEPGEYGYYNLEEGWGRIHWNGIEFSIESSYENHPVISVAWFGAWAFAEHYGYQLPTELEWEKAARGNTGWDYPWGDNIDGSRSNYWISGDPWDPGTTPIGMYDGQLIQGFQTTDSPSPFGVYDLAGNVSEWTKSFYYTGYFRVIRGGSWWVPPDNLKSWINNNGQYPDAQGVDMGFRCVNEN